MMGAVVSFTVMAVGGRELSHQLSTFQILFFRSLIALSFISLLMFQEGWDQVRTRRAGVHFLRNFSHFCGQFGWFFAIAYIPLAEVFAIEFTLPIWTVLFATVLLGEKLTPARAAAVVLGIIGVLLILRPGMSIIHPAAVVIVFSTGAYSLSYIFTKKLVPSESPLCILFYMTAMQFCFATGPAIAKWVTPSAPMWPWLALVGVTALTSHYCLARAMRLADAMVVAPMDLLRLPLVAIVAYLLYDEQVDWIVFSGAALMVAGNYLNVRAEQRRAA